MPKSDDEMEAAARRTFDRMNDAPAIGAELDRGGNDSEYDDLALSLDTLLDNPSEEALAAAARSDAARERTLRLQSPIDHYPSIRDYMAQSSQFARIKREHEERRRREREREAGEVMAEGVKRRAREADNEAVEGLLADLDLDDSVADHGIEEIDADDLRELEAMIDRDNRQSQIRRAVEHVDEILESEKERNKAIRSLRYRSRYRHRKIAAGKGGDVRKQLIHEEDRKARKAETRRARYARKIKGEEGREVHRHEDLSALSPEEFAARKRRKATDRKRRSRAAQKKTAVKNPLFGRF